MLRESKRIWGASCPTISPFCVRVPVLRAHSQAIWIRLSQPASRNQLRQTIRSTAGVQLVDSPAAQTFPTPRAASGSDSIQVGRIRPGQWTTAVHESFDEDKQLERWSVFVCGDQLRKGAALNAIQIAESQYGALTAKRFFAK